jgi:hypothetical protein
MTDATRTAPTPRQQRIGRLTPRWRSVGSVGLRTLLLSVVFAVAMLIVCRAIATLILHCIL